MFSITLRLFMWRMSSYRLLIRKLYTIYRLSICKFNRKKTRSNTLPPSLMVKPTTATTATYPRTTINNAPPPKRTQQRMSNSHRNTSHNITKVKEKNNKLAWRNIKKQKAEEEVIREGYHGNLKNLLGVPVILLVPKSQNPQIDRHTSLLTHSKTVI